MKASRFAAIAAGVAAIGLAGSALAQNLAAGPDYSGHITDTRTGKVWTPSLDSLDAYQPTDPNHPVNREFNPRDQRASIPGMVELASEGRADGHRADHRRPDGADHDASTRRRCRRCPASAGSRSCTSPTTAAASINPIVDCHFTNHGQKVESVRADRADGRPGRAARHGGARSAGRHVRRQGGVPADGAKVGSLKSARAEHFA